MPKLPYVELFKNYKELEAKVKNLECKGEDKAILEAKIVNLNKNNKELEDKLIALTHNKQCVIKHTKDLKGISFGNLQWIYAGVGYDDFDEAVKAKNKDQ